jgi:hypothetical protein
MPPNKFRQNTCRDKKPELAIRSLALSNFASEKQLELLF